MGWAILNRSYRASDTEEERPEFGMCNTAANCLKLRFPYYSLRNSVISRSTPPTTRAKSLDSGESSSLFSLRPKTRLGESSDFEGILQVLRRIPASFAYSGGGVERGVTNSLFSIRPKTRLGEPVIYLRVPPILAIEAERAPSGGYTIDVHACGGASFHPVNYPHPGLRLWS